MQKLHVITITNGNIDELRFTLETLDKQNFQNYKNLIISNKKINIEYKFKKKNRIFYYRPDSSIYEAMNYGLTKSHNKYIYFLNSGDTLISKNSLNKIYQNTKYFSMQSCLMFISILKNNNDFYIPKKKIFFSKKFFTHSSFIRPSSNSDKKFNLNKKITADGIWMKKNVEKFNIKKIFYPVSIFYLGGISNLPSLRSLKMKKADGKLELLKEFFKIIILKLVGKNYFYRIIYFFKYDRVSKDKINNFKIRKLLI